jgi:DNA-binding IclR family transcriptional regulator
MATQTGSQAVERASALLGLIVESGQPRTFSSLVDELGLAKSTTSRLLQALERSRLVHRDRAGAFRPGALFSLHAARPSALHDLSELARPTMEHLSELSRETVNLAVPRGGALVMIDQVDSRYLVGAVNWVGVDVPAHCTALGKVLYAFGALTLPQGNLERRTPRWTAPSSTTPSSRCAAGAGRRRSTNWSWGSPPWVPLCGPSTAPSSRPCRSPGRRTASTSTASPGSATSWWPSFAACRRCWATNLARKDDLA